MWCPSMFGSWSSTVYLVHHPSQYSYFITLLEPPPLCWRHTTFLLFLSIRFRLQHRSSASAFSPTDIFLDDCLSFNSQLILASHNNMPKLISAHWLLLTLLATLVLSLMNTSLSLTKYLLSLNLIIFVNSAVFALTLTSKLPVPSPLLSFILNLTTATHCTIIFHRLRWKDSRTSRTLLLVLSPERRNLFTSLLFLNLYTCSK